MNKREKAEKEAQAEKAKTVLRGMIKPGETVYTTLEHVSSSGMTRHIGVVLALKRDNGVPYIYSISHLVALALDYKRARRGGLVVGGCGMDMGYHVAHSLSRILYRDNFTCIGEGCPANDHFNGDPEGYRVGHKHTDGGYALRHEWI